MTSLCARMLLFIPPVGFPPKFEFGVGEFSGVGRVRIEVGPSSFTPETEDEAGFWSRTASDGLGSGVSIDADVDPDEMGVGTT